MTHIPQGIRSIIRRANNYNPDVLLRAESLALQAMRPFWVNLDRVLRCRGISYREYERRMKDYGFPVKRESISSAVKGHFSRFSFTYLCACADVLGYTYADLYSGMFHPHDVRCMQEQE